MLQTQVQLKRRNIRMRQREVARIPIDSIRPNPYQPRRVFSQEALEELCQSIRQYGLLQPISVRKAGNDVYELIAGERRLRACRMAGMTTNYRCLKNIYALAVGLAAGAFYAALILLNQLIRGINGLLLTASELLIAAVVLFAYVLLKGGGLHLPPDALGKGALAFLCVVNTALACYLYFSSMNRLSARSVALLGYIDPVSALVFAALFLGESMSAVQVAGAVLVLAGAAWGQSKAREERL